MMKEVNERTVSSLMSAYTEEDRRTASAVWRFLDASSGSVAFSEIGLKLNLDRETVGTALDRLMEKDCAMPDSDGQTETKYKAIIPKQ
jgi:hypothetical protein